MAVISLHMRKLKNTRCLCGRVYLCTNIDLPAQSIPVQNGIVRRAGKSIIRAAAGALYNRGWFSALLFIVNRMNKLKPVQGHANIRR